MDAVLYRRRSHSQSSTPRIIPVRVLVCMAHNPIATRAVFVGSRDENARLRRSSSNKRAAVCISTRTGKEKGNHRVCRVLKYNGVFQRPLLPLVLLRVVCLRALRCHGAILRGLFPLRLLNRFVVVVVSLGFRVQIFDPLVEYGSRGG